MRHRHTFLVLGLILTSGCLGVHHGHPDSRGPRNVESQERKDLAVPQRWRQIYFGSPPKPVLMGYLHTRTGKGNVRGTHFVYDASFERVGWISPSGQTFRITRRGEVNVGGYDLRHSLLRLWNRARETEVRLRPMPDPRG